MKIHTPQPMTEIGTAALDALAIAREHEQPVMLHFNSAKISVTPATTREQIIERWERQTAKERRS